MIEYIAEAEKYILPMLKKARQNFPEQASSYYMLKRLLIIQMKRDRFFLNALSEAGVAIS